MQNFDYQRYEHEFSQERFLREKFGDMAKDMQEFHDGMDKLEKACKEIKEISEEVAALREGRACVIK